MRRLISFLRLFIAFSLRHAARHRGRTIAVVCGIALGAAVFTSVRLAVHASIASFTRSMDFFAGNADRVLVQPGGYLSEEILARFYTHPAVRDYTVLSTTYARKADAAAPPFLLIGIDPLLDRTFREWRLRGQEAQAVESWLDLLREPYTVLLTLPLARELGLAPGARLRLEHTRRTADFRVAGLLEPSGLALVEGGRVGIVDIATFQELTGLYGKIDRIDLKFRRGVSAAEIEELARSLPQDLALHPPSSARESGVTMIRAYQLNLSVLSFASLFVGMFLVYSLVALNVAARRKELAILRALGAAPRTLFTLFLAEGGLLGTLGWLVALPLGAVLVRYLLEAVSRTISTLFVRVRVEDLELSAAEIAVSFAVTLVTSLLAAWQPAGEAMRIPPREAMDMVAPEERRRRSARFAALLALGCLAACGALLPLPPAGGIPLAGYLAVLLLFLGFALLSPFLLEHLASGLDGFLARLAGPPARLAGRAVRQGAVRTAVSVGALITAVALFTALVIMVHSFRRTVETWVRQTVSGELFVTAKLGQVNRFRFPIPEDIVDDLRRLDAAFDLVESRRWFLERGHFPYEFEAMGMETFFRHGDFLWLEGDPAAIRPRVARGEGVLVSEVFTARTGLRPGDRFEARIEGSLVDLPILGVVRDYRTDGGIVFYSHAHFRERFHDPRWSGVRFFFREPPADPEAELSRLRRAILERWGDRLDLVGGRELREAVLRIFDETFAVTTVLLLIALAVAALGITTTLTVLVLERSRQLNTILAVGGSPHQIRSMIFWEAAFLVVTGEGAGLACGVLLSGMLIEVINRQSFGWTFLYTVDWPSLGLSLPLIFTAALGAALPAVRAAFRQPPAALLRQR